MRLAIADPPYLGRAAIWYGDAMTDGQRGANYGGKSRLFNGPHPADYHPDAAEWDKPETHKALVERLVKDYDGWAIAMAHDNLRDYLRWVPADCRIGSWRKTQQMPGGSRVLNLWEPLVFFIPRGRRSARGASIFPPDAIVAARLNNGFPGAKPPVWTRWVLDLLGFDPAEDTVDDLFGGSGSVSAEIAQGVLL